tara:strand:+ start:595 stop:2154 length:1560 start_codon:yes stop_codon:yes gene_type:complete
MSLINDIVKKLVGDFGVMPNKARGMSYEDYASKWVNDMPRLVILNSTMNPSSDGCLPIKLSTIKKKVFDHRITRNGTKIVLVDWFNTNYPLWTEVKKGYSLPNGMREYTTIEGGPLWLSALEDMPSQFILDSYNKSVEDIDNFDDIAIDLDNLMAYYKHTKKTYDNGKGQVKFFRYAFEAITIIKLAEDYNKVTTCPLTGKKTHFIPQHYEFSETFGRKYYQGNVRLQSCNEMVRHGALGHCYALDIDASVYAYYLNKAAEYKLPDDITKVVRNIIDNKDIVRSDLATCLTNTNATHAEKIKLIKKALTAMGFGARVDNAYGAIKDIIYDKTDRIAFVNHDTVKKLSVFYKALTAKVMTDMDNDTDKPRDNRKFLTACVRNNPSRPDYDASKPFNKTYNNPERNYDANKKTTYYDTFKTSTYMASLYQKEETRIMIEVIDGLEIYGNETLLWVHDGIYVKNKPDMQLIEAVLYNQETKLTFSCEEINTWSNTHKNDTSKRINEIKEEDAMMGKRTLFTV